MTIDPCQDQNFLPISKKNHVDFKFIHDDLYKIFTFNLAKILDAHITRFDILHLASRKI